MVVLLIVSACSRPSPTVVDPPADEPSAPTVIASQAPAPSARAPIARRARHGGSDVTFYATSDLHVGYGYPDDLERLSADPVRDPVGLERANRTLIERMNALEGRAYPGAIGGVVGKPRGFLAAGDLTERGHRVEWDRFVALYGNKGEEGILKIPIFEVVGNHDREPGDWMEAEVGARHGGRYYSVDWDDVHVVALGEAPDDEGLAWLRSDLETQEVDVPIVIFFHRCLDGPWSDDNWFGDGDYRERLAALIADRNVIAILHGHHHASGHYKWRGIDVYKIGAVKDGVHLLNVFHVVDNRLTLARYNYDVDAWAGVETKSIR
jgi:hypothetical protein